MRRALFHRLKTDRSGAAGVEAAFLLPVTLAMILGVVEAGHMAWAKAALTYAVQDAARCAAVRKTVCATPANIADVAAGRVAALDIPPDAFTYTAEPCGHQVAARVEAPFLLHFIVPPEWRDKAAITARSCHA